MAIEHGTRMHSGGEINRSAGGGSPQVVVPVTTGTVAMQSVRPLYVSPAGTIAALTVLLPANPLDGDVAEIGFGQIVTTLTVTDAVGNAVATTAGAVGTAAQFRFVAGAWVRWR